MRAGQCNNVYGIWAESLPTHSLGTLPDCRRHPKHDEKNLIFEEKKLLSSIGQKGFYFTSCRNFTTEFHSMTNYSVLIFLAEHIFFLVAIKLHSGFF